MNEELKVFVLTVSEDSTTDEYYLIVKGKNEILVERILSDTAEEEVSIKADVELQELIKNHDLEGLRDVLTVEYGPDVKFKIEEYEGPKARLIVEKLALIDGLEEALKVFLV